MKEIKLTKGFVALVDDSDFDYLNQFKWGALKGTNTHYAQRHCVVDGKKTKVYMHREIMNPDKGQFVDHRDRDGLNCQRGNLRLCTRAQNAYNIRPHGAIDFLGVSKHLDKYRAQIVTNGKKVHLGLFATAEDAAISYNDAAKVYHGEYTNLNVIAL